jgi:FtsH-binding integral membrane protein
MVPQTNLYGFTRQPATADRAFAQFLTQTYAWMATGLCVSASTAYAVANLPALQQLVYGNRLMPFGLLLAQMALVFTLASKVSTMSRTAAGWLFLGYSLLTGMSLSVLFVTYTQASLAQCFFTSAVAFGGLSMFGVVTRRSMSGVGQFCTFGLFGMMAAVLVNLFIQSTALQFVASCAGVVIFSGLTAYDSQRLKEMYMMTGGAGNLAIHGALILYLDFINLFVSMLQLFGDRRRD